MHTHKCAFYKYNDCSVAGLNFADFLSLQMYVCCSLPQKKMKKKKITKIIFENFEKTKLFVFALEGNPPEFGFSERLAIDLVANLYKDLFTIKIWLADGSLAFLLQIVKLFDLITERQAERRTKYKMKRQMG